MTKIAFIGTGFVADYYMTTLSNYPDLELAGVWDRDTARLEAFCRFHGAKAYAGLSDLLSDPDIEIVVNLTTPESHFEINQAALATGKHVYCEKPLAMTLEGAQQVVRLAEQKSLTLCAAPANALSDAFSHTRDILAKSSIGQPRLVYAEMEDGPVFRANWQEWRSMSGAPWPGIHEFEIGCTLEHAGYALSWLVGLFGPVSHVCAFSALAFSDKGPGTRNLKLAPDFSVGCLTFKSGMVARLTSGLSAPRDRSMTIMGDSGTLTVRDLWDNRSAVNVSQNDQRSLAQKAAERIESMLGKRLPLRLTSGRTVPYLAKSERKTPAFPSQIDFCRGIFMQAEAIRTGTRPVYSGQVALHLTELALALSAGIHDYNVQTGFDPDRI